MILSVYETCWESNKDVCYLRFAFESHIVFFKLNICNYQILYWRIFMHMQVLHCFNIYIFTIVFHQRAAHRLSTLSKIITFARSFFFLRLLLERSFIWWGQGSNPYTQSLQFQYSNRPRPDVTINKMSPDVRNVRLLAHRINYQ